MNFCSNCGAPATGTPFCGNCGRPLAEQTGPAAESQSQQTVAGRPAEATGLTKLNLNPFGDIPALDYVRDLIALVLLLVSLGMPWDLTDSVTGKVYVILVTLLSVISLTLPYLKRGGVLPASWGAAELRLARLAANVPYFVVVLVTLVLGYVGEDGGDGVGVGLAFGLAGAVLAAQGRQAEQPAGGVGDGALWRWITLGIGALFVVTTVVSLVLFLIDNAELLPWEAVAYQIVVMLLFLALAGLPAAGALRGDVAWRDVLVLVGVVGLFVGVWQLSADETIADAWSLSDSGPQIVLIPALAAAAWAAGLGALVKPMRGAERWLAFSARLFQVVMLVAGFGVVLYTLQIIAVEEARGLAIVVLVLHLLVLVAAVVGRNALTRDPSLGRGVAMVCAGVLILIGIVMASVLGASDVGHVDVADATIISVLWWFAAAVIIALTAPPSVRDAHGPLALARPGGSATADAAAASNDDHPASGAASSGATAAGVAAARSDDDDVPPSPAVPAQPRGASAAALASDDRADADAAAKPAREPEFDAPVSEPPSSRSRMDDSSPSHEFAVPAAESSAERRRLDDSGVAEAEGADSVADEARPDRAPMSDDAATRVDPFPVVDEPASRDQQESGYDARTASDPNTPLQVLADIAAEAPELRKYVASNPSTYPELLTWLGQLGDPEVDEALRRRRP